MKKLMRVILLAYIVTVNPLDLILAQDDELPYNPFIDKQLESKKSYENNAVRDLGRSRMDMVVTLPAEVSNDVQIIKKASAQGEKPVIVLVYGRREKGQRQADVSEELQRVEIERQAFREGLRDTGIQVRGDIKTHKQPEAAQPN